MHSQEVVHKIACEPTWSMVHILKALKLKEKKLFSNVLRKWKFKVYDSNPEKRNINPLNYDEVNNADYIDMSIKVKQLKHTDVMLIEQIYCDIPEQWKNSMIVHVRHRSVSNLPNAYEKQTPTISPSKKEYEFLFNEISASRYQEFNVTKTNRFGNKQKRILGVDRYNLYNLKSGVSSESQSLMTTNVLKKAKTKRPLLPIRSIIVIQADKVNSKHFMIYYNDSYKKSVNDYEAEDESGRSEIIAKIKFILSLEGK